MAEGRHQVVHSGEGHPVAGCMPPLIASFALLWEVGQHLLLAPTPKSSEDFAS